MSIKIKHWIKIKKDHKEVIVDVVKLGFTPEQWCDADDDTQDAAVRSIKGIKSDWGYSILRG